MSPKPLCRKWDKENHDPTQPRERRLLQLRQNLPVRSTPTLPNYNNGQQVPTHASGKEHKKMNPYTISLIDRDLITGQLIHRIRFVMKRSSFADADNCCSTGTSSPEQHHANRRCLAGLLGRLGQTKILSTTVIELRC